MSGNYHILYWRDIPSMLKGKVGRQRVSQPLANRFMEAIDSAAMRAGDINSDEYLEHWRSSESMEIIGDAQEFLAERAAEIEEQYSRERLRALVKTGGVDSNP